MFTAPLAHLEATLRPKFTRLPAPWAVRLYSRGRRALLPRLVAERPPRVPIDPVLAVTAWGLTFRTPLWNAAGMFKNGEGYDLVARQGAGAYLAGTTTATPRPGNRRAGVFQPFTPYPRSGAASNFLGLPNEGHEVVAARLARQERLAGCPLGASLTADPAGDRATEDDRLAGLLAGLEHYARAEADFLELNESCPNTGDAAPEWAALERRLAVLGERFLARRSRRLPVIVKLSNDTPLDQLPHLLEALVEHGFDGVNFGNTSTAYPRHRAAIDPAERALFDHFTTTHGGGLSGRPLAADSLALAAAAVRWLAAHPPPQEFHVIRTGGVESFADLAASRAAGITLHQWYTGYFEAFARHGHGLYRTWFAPAT